MCLRACVCVFVFIVSKRNDIFLACKTENRTKDGARKLLEESLKTLKTDYFDLYQLHAVATAEDVEKILDKEIIKYVF